MLGKDDAWRHVHGLPLVDEADRRCKTSRLYYAAFHHARCVASVPIPDRRHRDFWGTLNTSGDLAQRTLSSIGRKLLEMREKADYHVHKDFTVKDIATAALLAREAERLLRTSPVG